MLCNSYSEPFLNSKDDLIIQIVKRKLNGVESLHFFESWDLTNMKKSQRFLSMILS